MRLEDLLKGVEYTCLQGSLDREVGQVVYDSRKISEDCLFICIEGANFDGHDFAAEAVEKGAGVLVVSKEVPKVRIRRLRLSGWRIPGMPWRLSPPHILDTRQRN